MIDFTRAFDSAWERMMIILFRPFDLGKWFVVGFSAFLAGLLSGGNGFNTSYRQNLGRPNQSTYEFPLQHFQAGMANFFSSLQVGLTILLVGAIFIFVIGLVVLFYWLGARGQFLFIDNLVRNRGAIAGPWKFYARPANQVFVLYLLVLAITFAVMVVLIVLAVILCVPLFRHPQWPQGTTLFALLALGLLYLIAVVVIGCILFIFREWGIPLMFRNGVSARAAFLQVMGLIKLHPGSTALFILLRMALWIALVVLSMLACCFTCCVAMLPYIGTVVLLPALVYIRCFSLDCLAQFGPSYDVWTVDVLPTDLSSSLNPPLPPG